MSFILRGKITYDYLITGSVVSLIFTALIIILIQHIRKIEKQADESLKKERDKSQHYLNVAGVILVAINAEQNVTMINMKGCEILGYKEHEIVGKNWFDHFIKAENIEEMKRIFNQMISGNIEPVEYYENPILIKDGNERIIAWHNSLIRDKSGRIIGTLSSGDDITERKRAEEALRESEKKYKILTESSQTGIYIHHDDKIVYANERFAELHGYTLQELLNMNYSELFHPSEIARVQEINSKRLRREDAPQYYETQRVKKDGGTLWCQTVAVCIEYQEKPAIMGNIVDITERKRVESALREGERLQGVFELAGAICHELNQPMQAIIGYSELLMMDIEDDNPYYSKIKNIKEQVEKLGKTTKKLANITKYETTDYLKNKIIDIDKSAT
jgi:PAS domain S-box-containing protein